MRTAATALLLWLASAACATPTGATLPAAEQDPTPLVGSGATIAVLGLSCPNCATNVDLVLKRLPGVTKVRVDLGLGLVDVGFGDGNRPSRLDLATAIRDSGFTVVAIEARP